MISETKLDDLFPTAQCLLHGFSAPYRLDRNSKFGGILLYIKEDIPSSLLNSKSKTGTETISVKIDLRKRKWFLNCSYNPNKNLLSNHLECLNRIMDEFSKNYENVLFLCDFNKRQYSDVLLLFKWSNKFDRSTNMLQKSWRTNMYWFNTCESP